MRSGFFREDAPALLLVVAAHVGLLGALSMFAKPASPPPIPPRMQVTISSEVSPTSTSPDPAAMPAPDIAPTKGEPAPAPLPIPKPAPVIEPAPEPIPVPRPVPVVKTAPTPVKRAVQPVKPAPPVKQAAPAKAVPARPAQKPFAHFATPGDERPRRRPDTPAGASMIGKSFLDGIAGGDARGNAKTPPAAAIGPAVKASLAGAIADQLQPHWTAPQGVDAEKLVTVLAWDLNADGSLAGTPRVVSQSGITEANRAQAARHAEMAVRAVRLSAPFKLPNQYYAAWKRVAGFRFDRNLSE
jgi:outer membrane biosynthesis protein TonB